MVQIEWNDKKTPFSFTLLHNEVQGRLASME
jgi:hypothetical protein